jgi:DNA polymerase-3 subunit gamma/tau
MWSRRNGRFIGEYRPIRFGDFKGIEDRIELIHRYNLRDQGCHFLICGPNGSGKSSLAETIERSIHCEQPCDGEPCLKCEACEMSLLFGYDDYKTDKLSGFDLDNIDYIHLIDHLNTPPLFSERMWHLVIEDLDYANKKALNGIIPFLDATPQITEIFTATDMKVFSNALKSRCVIIDLSSYSTKGLLQLALQIINKKNMIVKDASFLPELIEITNNNPRNLVNALEAAWLKRRSLDITLLQDQDFISNLGLTVGDERDNPL